MIGQEECLRERPRPSARRFLYLKIHHPFLAAEVPAASVPKMLRFVMTVLLVSTAAAQISFGPARELTDAISGSLAFAKATDMDGDGDLDVMAAEDYTVRVLWWRNNGAGSFTKQPEWLWGNTDWKVIGLDDWNGDGRADVWLETFLYGPSGSTGTRRLLVAVVEGNGAIADPVLLGEHQPPEFDSGADTFVARINDDSRPDVVASEGVYHADGNWAFPSPAVHVPGDIEFGLTRRYETTAFDAGNDGDADFLNSGFYTYNRLVFTRNLGAAGFAAPETLLAPEGGFDSGEHCVISEAGGLHRVLVLTTDSTDGSRALRSFAMATNGALSAQALLPLPATVNGSDAHWTYLRATPDGRAFVLCYLNLEYGRVPVSRIHEVTWLGGVLALTEIASYPGYVGQWQPEIVELNGDTFPDLLVSLPRGYGENSSPNWIVWHAGKPSGGFAAATGKVNEGLGELKLHHAGDVDGDGDADVLCGVSDVLGTPGVGSERIELWRNDGGNFERLAVPHGRDRIEIVGVTDVTGPAGTWHVENPNHGASWPAGRLDFLAQTYSASSIEGRFEWFFQDSGGVFHRWTAADADGIELTEVTWADWDGDGTKDLLSWELTGTFQRELTVRKGSGYGFASGSGKVKMELLSPTAPEVVDFDWDGDLDVVGQGYVFGTKPGYWLENDGSGEIAAIRGLPHALELAPDLDGDGHLDFTATGQILLARPGLLFEARPLAAIGPSGENLATFADLDGDGDLDCVVPVATDGLGDYTQIRWWENRGDARFSTVQGLPLAPARYVSHDQIKAGDLSGDGVPDLVVASTLDSRLEWFPVTRALAPTAFGAWMAAAQLTGHSAGPGSDWDFDGMANWDEFAFGSDPALGDPSHPGRPRLVRDGAGMSFTFHRRLDAASAGLSYPLERSGNLTDWDDWTPTLGVAPAPAGYEKITAPVGAGTAREFFRVALPDPP